MAEGKLVYTIPEVSELLGVSHVHGYLMAKTGQIPTIRLGRRIVVPKAAFSQLLANAGDRSKSDSTERGA